MIEKNIDDSLIVNILYVADLLKKKGDNICQPLGITTQQWIILLHLANDPNIPYFDKNIQHKPMMASELADSLNVSRPNITNILHALIDKGLVLQVEDAEDKRRKRLQLTAEGSALIEQIEPFRKAANKRLLASFSDEQKTQCITC